MSTFFGYIGEILHFRSSLYFINQKIKINEEKGKSKSEQEKTELQHFEYKMIGDEAKFLCDWCEYTANTNR